MSGLLVFLRREGGEQVGVEVDAGASVDTLSEEAQKVWGPRAKELRFQGKILKGGSALADTGVCSQSVVDVCMGITIRFECEYYLWLDMKEGIEIPAGLLPDIFVRVRRVEGRFEHKLVVHAAPEGCGLTPGMELEKKFVLVYPSGRDSRWWERVGLDEPVSMEEVVRASDTKSGFPPELYGDFTAMEIKEASPGVYTVGADPDETVLSAFGKTEIAADVYGRIKDSRPDAEKVEFIVHTTSKREEKEKVPHDAIVSRVAEEYADGGEDGLVIMFQEFGDFGLFD